MDGMVRLWRTFCRMESVWLITAGNIRIQAETFRKGEDNEGKIYENARLWE